MSIRPADPDVLVVGSGPAGAVAAHALARAGLRVTVLEREALPRQKPCGGGISARVLRRFTDLTPLFEEVPTRRLSKLHLEGPSGDVFRIRTDQPAVLTIRRIEFDQALAERARRAGADIVERAAVAQVSETPDTVTLTTRDGRVFRAPMVIAADGVNSVVARRLGLNPGWPPSRIALDMMEETPVAALSSADPETLWVFYGYGNAHGYAYVFPKRAHVNVGIGYLLSYFRERVEEHPYALQQRFVAAMKDRQLLDGASRRELFTPSLIPVGGPLAETARGRVLLAGDAGGFVNGFSAEGIYYAMATGELAARAVIAAGRRGAIVPGAACRSYVRAWKREMGAELRDSVLIQRYLFSTTAQMDAVVRGARAYPAFAKLLVDYATGRLGYHAARRRLLWRFPRLGARLTRLAVGRESRAGARRYAADPPIRTQSNP